MTPQEESTLRMVLALYGHGAQVIKAFEELGELTDALAKYHRDERATKEDVITELADVSIMVDQMALEFGYDDFLAERQRKIERLKTRLGIKEP